MSKVWSRVLVGVVSVSVTAGAAFAQDPPVQPPPEHVHDMSQMDMPMGQPGGWVFMQDGAAYALVNHQGGPRGGNEMRLPNWWMGMASREVGGGSLTLTGMFSLDPATVGVRGYRELFQVGEGYDGAPVIDRQHPHDFWMQLSAAWRKPLGANAGVTLAGALAGEPALGPVAFMHRASAGAIPLAPLGHHTFDSTHVAFGVATVALDRGPVTLEASAFNGREPDQQRWDLDLGRLDSFSGRIWLRPSKSVELQVSTGHLVEPEQLHDGNVTRSTASVSYLRGSEGDLAAVSVGVGMNDTGHVTRHAAFVEGSRGWGRTLASLRAEVVEVESMLLVTGALPTTHEDEELKDAVGALTLGIQRDLGRWRGLTAALGINGTAYRVPDLLRASHGVRPASFQLFFQLRPPVGAMGRMWNMRMAGAPMTGDTHAAHPH